MVLGITGGVATGKSTVVGMAPNMALRTGSACPTVSADAIARDLLDPGTHYAQAVIEHFGPDYALSGQRDVVNRTALARLIFGDVEARRWLEALLHPPIVEALREAGASYRGVAARTAKGLNIMVMEIPLLYEAGLENLADQVLVTRCAQSTQIRRILSRRAGITEQDALQQIQSQLPQDDKARRADYVIGTDQSLDSVLRELEQVFDELCCWAP